jgi:hypothetical protein
MDRAILSEVPRQLYLKPRGTECSRQTNQRLGKHLPMPDYRHYPPPMNLLSTEALLEEVPLLDQPARGFWLQNGKAKKVSVPGDLLKGDEGREGSRFIPGKKWPLSVVPSY